MASRSAKPLIRWLTAGDLPAAMEVLEEAFEGAERYWSTRLLGYLETLVAEIDGRVVGVAEIYETEARGYGRLGVVSYLAVKREFRRMGVGRSLVEAAEKIFRERGCAYVAASTRKSNKASQALFRKLGYELYERGSRVFEDLEGPLYAYRDDVVMLKKLSV
ncbi:GNAT family N-acetyltransferase [Thermofilum pendens]|uniref:GCN5-related N-acetyltransferase n=1 Tax=Thermofilum pendens (strain DSM 2475 / Hrk 5) TaxID=368408 RepID=A1S0K0_THEPD|nr:GNAT family N-acetyltransferase [Thermofilum pendens]ABL78980.1 GCN5-related N-acetyltransferase [Thermofilum pendens Hrk 5]